MSNVLFFMIAGLGTGALFAAFAQGLVVAYKGAGVINFSHGAVASYTAYSFVELRVSARLVVPPLPNPLSLVEGVANWFLGAENKLDLPNLPTFIDLPGDSLPTWMAFFLALGVAVVLGLLLHFAVFRPLRAAPALAKVVAAVGVMAILQQTVGLRFGSSPRNVQPILPNDGVEIFGLNRIAVDRLLLAGISIVLGLGLWWLYRRTRFGLATQAAAENEKGASLLGFSPDFQAGVNWVISTLIAGLVGILASPVTALTPFNFTLFLIPAFGAALLAGFNSIPIATGAAILLGMFDNLLVYLATVWTWLPTGSRELFPFLVIVGAMVLRGRSLPTRGAVGQGRLPFAPRPTFVWQGTTILGSLALLGVLFLPFDWRQAIMVTLIGTVIALSFVVLTGYVAQISLAQMSMAGVGAFALTRLSGEIGIPFPLGGLLAALTAALVGVLVGLPALRVRGVNLAVLTLAFGYAFQSVVLDNAELMQVSKSPPSPSLFGARFGPLDPFFLGDGKLPQQGFGVFLLVVTVLLVLAVANMRRGTTGRQMLAVRTNERAAAAAGVGVTLTKLIAFGVSSFIAGVGGVLLAYLNSGAVNRDAFSVLLSVAALATAYLGGITGVYGAVLAGTLTLGGVNSLLIEKLFHAGQWEQLVAGYALVLTAVLNPEGIAGAARHIVAVTRKRREKRVAVGAQSA